MLNINHSGITRNNHKTYTTNVSVNNFRWSPEVSLHCIVILILLTFDYSQSFCLVITVDVSLEQTWLYLDIDRNENVTMCANVESSDPCGCPSQFRNFTIDLCTIEYIPEISTCFSTRY